MSSLSSSEMSGKTLGDVWDVIRASGMSSGHRDIKDVIRDVGGHHWRCRGGHWGGRGRHVFPGILGKTYLPFLL